MAVATARPEISQHRAFQRAPSVAPEELARLLDLSAHINDLLDVGELLDQVAGAARTLLRTDMSAILILDPEAGRLEVAASDGIDGEIATGLATEVGENLAGRVAQTGKPLRCADVPADSRSHLDAVEEAEIASAMLVPLEHRGKVIGVLSVQSHSRRKFHAREQTLLQLLGNQAATALEKARLYAVEQRAVDELREMVVRVNGQNELMRRGHDAHERLSQIALEGLGPDALVEATAKLGGVPVVLVNRFACRIAAAGPSEGDEVDELWSGCRDSRAFAAQLERLRENAGAGQPDFVAEGGFWRTFRVAAAGEILGFIVALDAKALGEADVVILEQAANIVASELLRERSVAEAEARLRGDILRSLLEGGAPDAELRRRAALLGHDLTVDQRIVVVHSDDPDAWLDLTPAASAAAWASASAGLKSMFGNVEGEPVALLSEGGRALSRESVEAWIAAFSERLQTLGPDVDPHFGVSGITDADDEVAAAYESARRALAVSELEGGARVTHFEDVELIATLVSVADPGLLRRFVRRCIGAIEDYDRERGSALAKTLEVYLDRSRVARHAATELYLHPHSLRYRLRRINEIQGIDLDDPNERLMAHLALKLRSFL